MKLTFEFIKSLENNTRKFPIDKQISITNHSISILNNLTFSLRYQSQNDVQLLKMAEDTKKFTKSHPNVIFTRADKGNVTVALKDFYIIQINEMLQDKITRL